VINIDHSVLLLVSIFRELAADLTPPQLENREIQRSLAGVAAGHVLRCRRNTSNNVMAHRSMG
jgi:hypothetical protein